MSPAIGLGVWLGIWLLLSCAHAYIAAAANDEDSLYAGTLLLLLWPVILVLSVIGSPIAIAYWLGKRRRP